MKFNFKNTLKNDNIQTVLKIDVFVHLSKLKKTNFLQVVLNP